MSVINQMLQDLEKRQHEVEKPSYVGQTVSKSAVFNQKLLAVVGILLLITVALLVVLLLKDSQPVGLVSEETSRLSLSTSVSEQKIEPVADKELSSESTTQVKIENIINTSENQQKDLGSKLLVKKHNADKSISSGGPQVNNGSNTAWPNDLSIETQSMPSNKKELLASVDKKETLEASSSAIVASKAKDATPTKSDNGDVKPVMKLEQVTLSKGQLLEKKRSELSKAKAQQDMEASISLAREIYQLAPRDINGVQEYTALLYANGQVSLAADILHSSLGFDSAAGELRLMLAKLYYQQNNSSAAIQTLKAFSGQVTQASELISFRAALYQQSKMFRLSNSDYQSLVAYNSTNASWLLGLAISSEQLGDKHSALISYYAAKQKPGLSAASIQFIAQRIQVLEGQ